MKALECNYIHTRVILKMALLESFEKSKEIHSMNFLIFWERHLHLRVPKARCSSSLL